MAVARSTQLLWLMGSLLMVGERFALGDQPTPGLRAVWEKNHLTIRDHLPGPIYVVRNNVKAFVDRFQQDFPEQTAAGVSIRRGAP